MISRLIFILVICFLIIGALFALRAAADLSGPLAAELSAEPDPYNQLLELRRADRGESGFLWVLLIALSLFALGAGYVVVSDRSAKLLRSIKSFRKRPRSSPRPVTTIPHYPDVQPLPGANRPEPVPELSGEVPLWTDAQLPPPSSS